MGFKEKLGFYKELIDKDIIKYFEERADSFQFNDPFVTESFELLKDYTLRGGKRFRAASCILSYNGFSGDKSNTDILRPASGLEFMQSSLLVHDDVMDKTKFRRGKPTAHEWIKKWYLENVKKDEERAAWFGNSMAVVLGDLYNSFGFDCVINSNFPEDKKLKAVNIYNSVYDTVGRGQVLDLWFGERGNVSEQEYWEMIYRKTTVYTVKGPMEMGATLAGASKEDISSLAGFSVPIAQAFQMQDDILDFVADEKTLGKPIGTDLKEGKNTLLIIKFNQVANDSQKAKMAKILGNWDATPEQIQEGVDLLTETGAFDAVRKRTEDLIEEGKVELAKTNLDSETKEFFNAFADYMINRDY